MALEDAPGRRSLEEEADAAAARVEKEVASAREALEEHLEALRLIGQRMLDSSPAQREQEGGY